MTGREFTGGGSFVLDAPEHIPAVWGDGQDVLWSQGEPLLIAGPPGVRKSTLAQRLILARCGVGHLEVLGHLVTPDPDRRVAYIAADRPRQAARSMRRMVADHYREQLDERLLVWEGPLPFNLAADPAHLAEWLAAWQVGTVVIDSLKDVAVGLSEDAIGAAVAQAQQHVIAAGIELVALHHQRKATNDASKKPRALDDVYGSAWLTAVAGSVVLLWGEPGDPIIELRHLKQPANEVGPLEVHVDDDAGDLAVAPHRTIVDIVRRATNGGMTARDAAATYYGVEMPTKSQVEKARRKLDRLVSDGWVITRDGELRGAKREKLYVPVDLRFVDQRGPTVEVPVDPTAGSTGVHATPINTVHEGSTQVHAPPSLPLKGEGVDHGVHDADAELERLQAKGLVA